MTADGSSSPMSGPAACQKMSSITSAGTGSRQPVTTFPVGTCQSRANGMSASSPASLASASQYVPPGLRVIAIISRMTSGQDMIRRRCRGFSLPAAIAASTAASITPSPRWRSSSPSRTRSGSHPSASTVPSRRTTAGTVTTGRQNTASSPAAGAASPAAVTVPPRTRRPAARSTTLPAGVPASADAAVRVASTTSGRVQLTRGTCERMDFDTQTLSRSPSCIQTRAKPQVTASWIPACLKSLVLTTQAASMNTRACCIPCGLRGSGTDLSMRSRHEIPASSGPSFLAAQASGLDGPEAE